MLRVSCITHPCSRGCSVPEFWQVDIERDREKRKVEGDNLWMYGRTKTPGFNVATYEVCWILVHVVGGGGSTRSCVEGVECEGVECGSLVVPGRSWLPQQVDAKTASFREP
jgi:hypothetical protein